MPKSNREYKKGRPFRDSKIFVIVAEGEREDQQFQFLATENSRIRMLIVERANGASAPKYFIDRLNAEKKAGNYKSAPGDLVWFVCDTDRWGRQLDILQHQCKQNPSWNLAISNPCFEVWLHLHAGPVAGTKTSCSELKKILPKTLLGEFSPETYCAHIERAVGLAKQADVSPKDDFPAEMTTKVYKLGEQLCQVIAQNQLTRQQ